MKEEKSRVWFATIQKGNMRKAGLTEEQIMNHEYVANHFKDKWEQSGKDRKACVSTCISASGNYHLHAALYGPPTTIKAVASCMYDSHVEPAVSKQALVPYIRKEGEYSEKGEQVLYTVGEEQIVTKQGHRSDLDVIKEMIENGKTPDEVMGVDIRYRRYEKMINSEFDYQSRKNTPYKKKMCRVWHYGNYDSGIEMINETLIKKYGQDKVFYAQYTGFGSLDTYTKMGNPPVLVVDNIGYETKIQDIYSILNEYTNTKIRCRYEDITPLWTEVHLLSAYSIEEFARLYGRGKYVKEKLLKNLEYIEYHYLQDGIPTTYRILASLYTNSEKITEDIRNNILYGEVIGSGDY